ncbi:FadR/GntR family transcriptional regulator [Aurantiacibacter flavus]|uniref:FadR/GntR family transcriptional regulator n=1 Tax=Aurantiacibacter flavus TaxID=3145232 RepID=A0ABV0CRS8_9SPHN
MESPRRTSNLSQQLVDRIGAAIVRGDYGTEASLPIEAKLSEEFQASRSVTREAIKMLTAKGLVGSRPRRGTFVEPETNWNLLDPDVLGWILQRTYSPQLMREFLQVRMAVEPAAALAAQMANEKGKARIREALDGMKAAARGEADPLLTDIAFHSAVLRASGNRFFAQFVPFVETALRFTIQVTNRAKGVRMASVGDHETILRAIEAGDAAQASRAVTEILNEAIALVALRDEPRPGG